MFFPIVILLMGGLWRDQEECLGLALARVLSKNSAILGRSYADLQKEGYVLVIMCAFRNFRISPQKQRSI